MGVRLGLWLAMVLVATWAGGCHGHGRLIDPPSRASAWRYGFKTPIDYNDNEGFCGGFNHQYNDEDGKCGLCGDAWDESPRPHEVGGKYATGTIVRTYTKGEVITVAVDVTANHRGHFEFRICPNNNPRSEATQTCLNEHPLFSPDGSVFKHFINSQTGVHTTDLRLPQELTCTQCVLQWRYVAGNNWGTCENGTGAVGCGPQEEFRACADVAITGSDQGETSTTTTTTTTTTSNVGGEDWSTTTTTTVAPPITTTKSTTTTQANSGKCRPVGAWKDIPGMDTWCETNCYHTPPYCPSSHCDCSN